MKINKAVGFTGVELRRELRAGEKDLEFVLYRWHLKSRY